MVAGVKYCVQPLNRQWQVLASHVIPDASPYSVGLVLAAQVATMTVKAESEN